MKKIWLSLFKRKCYAVEEGVICYCGISYSNKYAETLLKCKEIAKKCDKFSRCVIGQDGFNKNLIRIKGLEKTE